MVLLMLFPYLLINLFSLTFAQPEYGFLDCYKNLSNYTANSTYQRNLKSLLTSLASDNQVENGFYNLSVGQSPDQVYANALCRGDISLNDCRTCVNITATKIQECPNQKQAMTAYDWCVLYYSNRSLSGYLDFFVTTKMPSPNNVSSDLNATFSGSLQNLMYDIRDKALSGNFSKTKFFATGDRTAEFYRIYGLIQCTPNLSEKECRGCMDWIISNIQTYLLGREGGRVVVPSCNLRFETGQFYEDNLLAPADPEAQPPAQIPPPPPGEKSNTTRIIIIVVSTVSIATLIASICILIRRRRNVKSGHKPYSSESFEIDDAESLQFSLDIIRTVTNDFSEDNKLGQGGFGAVYKGTLPNGKDIAVKRLSRGSGQGDLEFKNEVLLVAKLQHRNLARLLGFCLEGTERLLVYEFVPNSSLDRFVFDSVKRANLNWEIRYKIICGIARGLLYLHEDSRLRIIHRDMKASNVLLDEEMTPKISDFGMAKLCSMDQSQDNTSRIVGTYGYMAPEYAMHGHFSVKSDVYSYGVLVLEMLTGQKNSSFRIGENVEDLLSSAWKNWRDGTFQNLIDPTMRTDGSMAEMIRCVHIALLCVQENVATRPTMASVVLMLSSQSMTLSVPSEPAFFIHNTIESDMSTSLGSSLSKTETAPPSKNDVSITELYPR